MTAVDAARVSEALRLELRRGTLVLAVLAVLVRERNGTEVRKELVEAGLPIEEGALYPMLRRLEEQGLLDSSWRVEQSRKKRFYLATAEGRRVHALLLRDWRHHGGALARLKGLTKDVDD